MPLDYFPRGTSIKRPRCSGCRSRMMLTHTSSGPVGFEHRWFECRACKSVTEEVVASDPMNSNSEGWVAGETPGSELRVKSSTDRPPGMLRSTSRILRKESELQLHWAELQELEENVTELTVTALQLAPGAERRDSLVVIGSFRAQIAAMKRAELVRASKMHRLKTA